MPTAHMLMIQLYNKYQVIPCSQNTACLVQYNTVRLPMFRTLFTSEH